MKKQSIIGSPLFSMPKINVGLKKKPLTNNTRYFKQPKDNEQYLHTVEYKNAAELAEKIDLKDGKFYCILHGNFEFGDLIEAFLVRCEPFYKVENLTISTLSFSQNNIDSLNNLMEWGIVKNLNILTSTSFFGEMKRLETHCGDSILKYAYRTLDKNNNNFQLGIFQNHMKIVNILFDNGEKICIHGSANLRSSNSLEFITIERNPQLYDFMQETMEKLLNKYKTINKNYVLMKEIWDTINIDKIFE